MKPIPGFERYSISKDGSIYSTCRRTSNKCGDGFLRQKTDKDGYAIVALFNEKGRWDMKVHRLVLLTYKGPPPKGSVVDHKDGDKSNNNLSNLEYVSQSTNCIRAYKLGLRVGMCGASNPACKVKDYAPVLKEARKGTPYAVIAKSIGVGESYLSKRLSILGYRRKRRTKGTLSE